MIQDSHRFQALRAQVLHNPIEEMASSLQVSRRRQRRRRES